MLNAELGVGSGHQDGRLDIGNVQASQMYYIWDAWTLPTSRDLEDVA
jgi:hypothetical protein